MTDTPQAIQNKHRVKALNIYGHSHFLEDWITSFNELGVDVSLLMMSDDYLQYLNIISPDLILIEHHQEDRNVLDLCQKIRRVTQVPMLLITSFIDEDFICNAYEAGVDDCIIQPISLSLFLAKLRAWLRYI